MPNHIPQQIHTIIVREQIVIELTRFNSFFRSSLRYASVGFMVLPPFVVFTILAAFSVAKI